MDKDFATRKLRDAVGSIRNCQGECVVLMGAGCSKSAGIPLAGQLVQQVEADFPEAFERARQGMELVRPGYNQVMEQLAPRERQALLNPYIEAAQINWAHLALAQLFRHRKVNRILTVNFDPLLVKACSMVGFFPAIYDLAGTDQFKKHRIAPQSLFYLNGQHTGFVTLNAADELQAHKAKLRTIIDDTGVNRLWIVVGYSGESDPLLDILAEQQCFDGDLYWLGHDAEPSARLQSSRLFASGRHAFYVGGQDSDACLTDLAKSLDCFPPEILVRPFEHLKQVVGTIRFDTGGNEAQAIKSGLLDQLDQAAGVEREPEQAAVNQAEAWLLAGQYGKVLTWFYGLKSPSPKAVGLASWSCVMQGVQAAESAAASEHGGLAAPEELANRRLHWAQAGRFFAKALDIKADRHEAAYNWGLVLDSEAQALTRANDLPGARELWKQAGEKYAQALAIKPDKHDAANNWGSALDNEARALIDANDLPSARAVWKQAGEKYAQALAIKADKHDTANNWGVVLDNEARALKEANDLPGARALWKQASEKYAQALAIKADLHDAANNWGIALAKEAQALKEANELPGAQVLWKQAYEKFARALAIKADNHEAANKWGISLAIEAQALKEAKDLSGARALWKQAGEKYAQALAIKADNHDAANNWGSALDAEARALKEANDLPGARALWKQAGDRYAQTLAIKADKFEAAYNWGLVLDNEAQALKESNDLDGARTLWKQAGEKYAQALAIKADMHEAACRWGVALANEARALKEINDLNGARALWTLAGERYARALTIKPDMYDAAYNWGGALDNEAQALREANDLPGARALWKQAGKRYAQALAIKSDMHDAANHWGAALLHEFQALVNAGQPDAAHESLAKATQLLEAHSAMDGTGSKVVAYNLGCAYSLQNRPADAVTQLELSRAAELLPRHWRMDADLDPIRNTPEYLTWVQTHFPDSTDPTP